jgi:hypothetical protein
LALLQCKGTNRAFSLDLREAKYPNLRTQTVIDFILVLPIHFSQDNLYSSHLSGAGLGGAKLSSGIASYQAKSKRRNNLSNVISAGNNSALMSHGGGGHSSPPPMLMNTQQQPTGLVSNGLFLPPMGINSGSLSPSNGSNPNNMSMLSGEVNSAAPLLTQSKGAAGYKGKRSGGSRNTPLTGNTQNPKSPAGQAVLTPTKNLSTLKAPNNVSSLHNGMAIGNN